jgi:mRNA-degrading endonuclease RelE of RelBE toxin-antitoxin system
MYRIELTPESIADLAAERKFDQARIVDAMESHLSHEPKSEARNRKRLRPNQLAEWVLRVDNFRVFYDVVPSGDFVKVVAIGRKTGSALFIHGEKFEL